MGFNQKELKGIAARIADNLKSDADAQDDDVNVEIDTMIDMVTPFLSFGQSQANRLLDEWKKNHAEQARDNASASDEPGATPDGKTAVTSVTATTAGPKTDNPTNKTGDTTPAWAKALSESITALTNEVSAMKSERTRDAREERLKDALKDTGAFGERLLKDFPRMRFDSDDDFDSFMSDVGDSVKAFAQERADKGLKGMGGTLGASGAGDVSQKVLSDKELDELAKTL